MTDATADSPDALRLRELLHESPADPAAAARELQAERSRLQAKSGLEAELLGREQRWLEGFHATGDEELRHDLVAVHHDWLALRVRHLAAALPTVTMLLDLAEARAAARVAGAEELERAAGEAIDAGLERLEDEAPGQEVAERFALLTTAIDELAIEEQIELLRETGRLLLRLGDRTASKRCRRFGRRLLRAADDRELARRLERRLGRRGVAALESTNFVLLLVVLLTLVIEWSCTLTEAQQTVFLWIDAVACLFFIADFAFELLLHPSRLSWFWRNALTDLVPAIPSVLLLPDLFLMSGAPADAGAGGVLLLRTLRLLRVTWAARYVQALRPILRSARLLLFLVRGLDGLAARFAQILNREFVFVPSASEVGEPIEHDDLRDVLFDALRREHELVLLLPREHRHEVLKQRITAARSAMDALAPAALVHVQREVVGRDIAIGEAIEFLYSLRTQDLGRYLQKSDVQALDRVVRVLSTVPVRWLPIIRRLAVYPLPASPDERILELARRVADWLESWHGRMLFFADLHGIVTGPQILDRVASAMVKATQRPAVRLVLFGGLFLLLDRLVRGTVIGEFLTKVVGLPLILLGSFCMVFLLLGHWLKRLAGEASDSYRLTSEAHFISQLERVQSRYEDEDLDFLVRRVFADPQNRPHARKLLEGQLDSARTGVPIESPDAPHHVCLDCNRIALLYLHFLDGAPLHISDVKTTEQLLANQSLENLRQEFLRIDGRERRMLRKLKLDDGSLFSGPYLWFRFITESVAVEAAKRIAGYNSYCIPLSQRRYAEAAALEKMERWLLRRSDPRAGRTAKGDDGEVNAYPTTEFTALDFLGGDPERDRHLAAVFGEEVLAVVRFDRRTMIREIFGTRPVNHLPKHERSFNPLRFYEQRLSHGRVLLAPVLLLWRFVRTVGWVVSKVRQIVREVLDPEVAMQTREIGEAPFAVALRKIHRMKAPGLLEAIRLRLRLDPAYAGAPVTWTHASQEEPWPELLRDLRFLHLREREAAHLREQADEVRGHVAALHVAAATWPPFEHGDDPVRRRAGELAVTCAWVADTDDARTLLGAERWRSEVVPELLAAGGRAPLRRRLLWSVCGLFRRHPVDVWLERHGQDLPKGARLALRIAYDLDLRSTRRIVRAWGALEAGASPRTEGLATLRRVYRHGPAVRSDVMALRAIQSMAVLDVRNYRDLVFRLGEYERDGESPSLGHALP